MSDNPLTDAEIERICLALALCIRLAEETAPKCLHSETRMGLSRIVAERKDALEEIARLKALPAHMRGAVVRPVYPVSDTEEGKKELEKDREIATLREANRVLFVELTETITLVDRGNALAKPIIDEDLYDDG